ncbi:MAG: glycosyltransferase family 2 protein [Acidimicrobiales bacterium]
MPQPSSEISIVLPAYNEEDNIVAAVTRATEVADRLFTDHEVIVVDDGSSDRTASLTEQIIAGDPRVRLVRHGRNRGYGEALRSGFNAARMDLVFFTDADNQFDLTELDRFLPWIEKVDVVAGYRRNRQDRLMRRVNGIAWNLLVRALFYVPVRDIDCAFKLFRRSVFKELDLKAVGAMVNTELMVKLGRSGCGVVEIPVTHLPRTAGQARGANPRVIAKAFHELFAMYRRLKVTDAHASTDGGEAEPAEPTPW